MKIIKITTIYNETFITELYYMGKTYINTAHGIIDKEEIKEFVVIGEKVR